MAERPAFSESAAFCTLTMRKLILRNGQSPGDIVMATAAVRDLKRAVGAALAVDVRTPCPALWENSPHLTPLADGAAGAEEIACGYPLIHRSNTGPYLHTNGALRCCDNGGCWKARVVPLGDGDGKDAPERLCVDVAHLRDPALDFIRRVREPVPAHAAADAPEREATDFLPRCMEMISVEDVIRRIELYFDGGAVRYLTDRERQACEETIPELGRQSVCMA